MRPPSNTRSDATAGIRLRLARAGVISATVIGLALAGTAIGVALPQGAAQSAASHLAKLPPLIERHLFFADPEISAARLSPDGRFLSFLKPHGGVRNIWVKGIEEPFSAARPVTADTKRPVRIYFWSEDGKQILYSQDRGGDENFHVYAVDPAAAADAATGVPPARDLTPIDGVRAFIYAVPEATPGSILIGLNDRDRAVHDVYRLDLATGARTLVLRNDQNVAQWIADLGGQVRLGVRQTPDGGTEILRVVDGKLGDALYTCGFEESCFPIRFHHDGRQVYLVSNRGEDVDLTRLLLVDVESGKETVVDSDPEKQVDFGGALFSDRTEELVGTMFVGDRVRIYPRSDRFAAGLDDLRSKLPDGEISVGSVTNDDRLALVSLSRDVDPGTTYLYDWERGSLEKLYSVRPELESEALAPMRAIRYRSRDGVEIPAYLTIPRGAEPRGLPTVVVPHGGPWARDIWGYQSDVQFLANRGYAVLSMNFRGSSGYGKAFLNAGNREWGTGIMQHDITDGVRWLVEEGIADPKRIAIMGGSYGGYATLAGLAFTPDLYAAGVSIVGPSNIFTLLRSIPPYWRPTHRTFHLRVGDPESAADRARLEAQSPFFHAERIRAPLLVIQGANDPRVKKAESEQIVVRLRDLGREVEYLLAADEGHGFARVDNQLAMWAQVEDFLARRLGGRAQEIGADEKAKVAQLRVDVKSLEMPDSAKTTLRPTGR